jgi:hypothetical protein
MMKYRTRTFYTETQKSEMWDRWQRGESLSSIGRRFNRASSSIYPLLARTGGIRPPARVRSRLALSLFEREEISRGLRGEISLRSIARSLKRPASTISREVRRNGGTKDTVLRLQMQLLGIAHNVPSPASWQGMPISAEPYRPS